MRHAKYFDKDLYSKFHRKYDGIAMIDIDSVEICQRKGCWKVLAIIEHLYDTGSTKKKYTNIVEEIGKSLNVPVFLVYYKEATSNSSSLENLTEGTLTFRVAQLHPIRTPLNTHCEAEWVDVLRSIHSKHEKVCTHAK